MGSIPQLSVLKGPSRPLKPNFLHRIFEENLQKYHEKIALQMEDPDGKLRQHSYQSLNEKTNQLARVILKTIREKQLPRNNDGDYIIAVCMKPSDELVAILLAIWKAGCAYLPIDPTFPANRVEHILRESKPVAVIYSPDNNVQPQQQKQPQHNQLFDELSHKLSVASMQKAAERESKDNLKDDECVKHLKDDLAIVLYTSGSTGVPKGVRLPHRVLLNRLQWQFKTFPYAPSECVGVFKTALTFVDSVSEIWGPLLNGLTVLVVPKCVTTDPERLIAILDKYKIERLVLVPSLLRSMLMFLELKNNKNQLNNLKIWVCSGETLVVSLAQEFFDYFTNGDHILCNFYGSTEIMGDVTYHVISNKDQLQYASKVPIGAPVDNTMLYLLDKDYRPVKAGEVGELFVAGLNLAAGYVNNRDPEKFISNPLAIDPTFSKLFRTGDFASVEKGYLQYEGRTDSQVKIRGHRVDLSEVDKAVNSLQEVEKGVVLCYQPGEINQALLAFVTTTSRITENEIEGFLREKLSNYMVPQVILIESIPLLVNGKIDRQALLKMYECTNNNDDSLFQAEIDYNGVPQKKMEAAKVLFETVAQVLNRGARAAINVNANFYEIGGNSLNSIFTISNLKEKGYHVSIGDFIAAIDLGEVLERMVKNDDENQVEIKIQPKIYRTEMLGDKHKEDTIRILTASFFEKADLERWIISEIADTDYAEILNVIWTDLVAKALSFATISADTGKCIAVALNFDAHDEPAVEITSKLTIVFEFLEFLEGPIRDNQLPNQVGDVLHSFMMGTDPGLSAKENVAVIQYMEDEVLKLAQKRRFKGIMTTNTSPLTQQLGSSVFGYKTLLDYQVNEYVAPDNTKPFGLAPASQRAIVHWKEL
ncbi:beta-alanyl-bioamine nonribosomal peptide synthetase ebony isoform X2 [Atheta coriaria]